MNHLRSMNLLKENRRGRQGVLQCGSVLRDLHWDITHMVAQIQTVKRRF